MLRKSVVKCVNTSLFVCERRGGEADREGERGRQRQRETERGTQKERERNT